MATLSFSLIVSWNSHLEELTLENKKLPNINGVFEESPGALGVDFHKTKKAVSYAPLACSDPASGFTVRLQLENNQSELCIMTCSVDANTSGNPKQCSLMNEAYATKAV